MLHSHEIAFYGLVTSIVLMFLHYIDFSQLYMCAFHPVTFEQIFCCYLFWSTTLFIPISVICAFQTKYEDKGIALYFYSEKILIIMFGHIAEEIIGLVLAPFWFLMQLFSGDLTLGRIVDYVLLLLELLFIFFGILRLI